VYIFLNVLQVCLKFKFEREVGILSWQFNESSCFRFCKAMEKAGKGGMFSQHFTHIEKLNDETTYAIFNV
jgi:hypothetical protein